MKNERSSLEMMHESEGREKINKLEQKILTTKTNIEISDEIIGSAPSDAQREKLMKKKKQRVHAIGSMQKEIRDIEQTMKEREKEVSV